jgi:hypothetical protein
MTKDHGRIPVGDRARLASPRAAAHLGHSEPIPCAVVSADARTVSGSDFLDVAGPLFGMPVRAPRDRRGEAEYLDALNRHYREAKAKADRIRAAGPREGETRIDHLKRCLEPLYAHDEWRREQATAWVRGEWKPQLTEKISDPFKRDMAA